MPVNAIVARLHRALTQGQAHMPICMQTLMQILRLSYTYTFAIWLANKMYRKAGQTLECEVLNMGHRRCMMVRLATRPSKCAQK